MTPSRPPASLTQVRRLLDPADAPRLLRPIRPATCLWALSTALRDPSARSVSHLGLDRLDLGEPGPSHLDVRIGGLAERLDAYAMAPPGWPFDQVRWRTRSHHHRPIRAWRSSARADPFELGLLTSITTYRAAARCSFIRGRAVPAVRDLVAPREHLARRVDQHPSRDNSVSRGQCWGVSWSHSATVAMLCYGLAH